MVLESQPLWIKVLVYTYILGGLFIYTKLAQLKYKGVNLVKTRDSILLSAFFPVALILLLTLGSVIFLALFSAPLKSKLTNILRRNKISLP